MSDRPRIMNRIATIYDEPEVGRHTADVTVTIQEKNEILEKTL